MSAELQRMLDEDFRLQGALSALAYTAHKQQADAGRTSNANTQPPADLTGEEIVGLLSSAQYLRSEDLAREFVSYVDESAGLLVGNGGRDPATTTYSFPHRTFQEYLAGRYLMTERRGMTPLRECKERANEGD